VSEKTLLRQCIITRGGNIVEKVKLVIRVLTARGARSEQGIS
jgi:hypothetical protein